jgi:hypothetical protein
MIYIPFQNLDYDVRTVCPSNQLVVELLEIEGEFSFT